MQSSDTNHNLSPTKIKQKTLNAKHCNKYYRKYNPELPTSPINGRKYNPKFKWVALAITVPIGETHIFQSWSDASGLKKALTRLGYYASCKRNNQGYHITNEGFLRRVV
jgi:hypothetical protein